LHALEDEPILAAMMGHREKLSGDGFDAFARFWRRHIVWRRGEVAKIKRRYSKRNRRDARLIARNGARG
jgi:hypothetical protein